MSEHYTGGVMKNIWGQNFNNIY